MNKPASSFLPKKNLQSSISRFFVKTTTDGQNQPATSASSQLSADASNSQTEENGTDFHSTQKTLSKRPFNSEKCDAIKIGTGETARPAKRSKYNESSPQSPPSPSHGSNDCLNNTTLKPKKSSQAEKYLLRIPGQPDPTRAVSPEENHDAKQSRTEQLHNEWLKKMRHTMPGSSFSNIDGSKTTHDEGSEGDEDDEIVQLKKKGTKASNLTPLEIQFLEIKRKHLDTILITEVGYKFKFFGEDARIAAKELSIVCIPGKFRYDGHSSEAHLGRFASASIPVHRLSVHAKRLVQAGYKIGVVRQVETAALKKAGDNRNTPFTRKLTNIYTKGTYIDDSEEVSCPINTSYCGASVTGYLLCLTESKLREWVTDGKVKVGLLAVQPSTGDVIYDTFEDGPLHEETQTRLMHLNPCEIIIVGELSQPAEKLIQHLSTNSTNMFGDQIRLERMGKEKNLTATAHSHVSQFYAVKLKTQQGVDENKEKMFFDKVLNLSEEVTVCLSAMITYLTEFGLEHLFDLTRYFEPFSTHSHMLLNANTLTSLEIYRNQTEFTEKGSLFWTLDKTQTRFGQRLLRKWVGRPLLDKTQIEDRVGAVEELKNNYQTSPVQKIQSLLRSIKYDLERTLIRIYYGKCNRPEVLNFLETLQKISNDYSDVKSPSDTGFKSNLLNSTIVSLPSINSIISGFLLKISVEPARKDDKYAFFHPDYESELITDHKMGIAVVEQELDSYRSSASSTLKKGKPLSYITNAGIEYLFEISNSDLKHVPASWFKVSGNKKISRFHTPEVVSMLRERDQHKESLTAACDAAFLEFLIQISHHYASLRDVINALATLDCLQSLCLVALQPGYTKPEISSTTSINIIHGRHPMVEQLLPSAYIANNTCLSMAPGQTRALCITGPNMGGKSSYVRHVALLVVMTQIGSYLPCESANIGIFDSIFTRMGAYDSLFTRQSTFQIELAETATILQSATARSLVILDELGRGTSTHDGVAIAGSTLEWLVREKKCLCLFITHYQSLATVAKEFESDSALKNMHMKFESNQTADPTNELSISGNKGYGEEITFLYEIGEGVAHRSYGLNVARLANMPSSVLEMAAKKSHEMEMDVKQKKLHYFLNIMNNLFQKNPSIDLGQLFFGKEEL